MKVKTHVKAGQRDNQEWVPRYTGSSTSQSSAR